MVKTRRQRTTAGGVEREIRAWAGVLADALAHPVVDKNGRVVFRTRKIETMKIPPPKIPMLTMLCSPVSEFLTLQHCVGLARYILRALPEVARPPR